jgi:replicative DNA helicase
MSSSSMRLPEGKDDVKALPHAPDAERGVLSAMLMDVVSCGAGVAELTGKEFYKIPHQKIFESLSTLYRASKTINPATLSEELRRAGT